MNLETAELTNFINLTENAKLMILKWRNDENVKKWMYNSEIISIENHLKFIEALEKDENNQYFLLNRENENIGVIYFNNIDFYHRSTEFGLYANPDITMSGVGKILEKACIEYAFDVLKLNTLKLEVLSENIRALHLYKKFKFKEINKKIVNNREIICMELKNEDR